MCDHYDSYFPELKRNINDNKLGKNITTLQPENKFPSTGAATSNIIPDVEQEKIRIPVGNFPPFGQSGEEVEIDYTFEKVKAPGKSSENNPITPPHYNGNECQDIILKMVKGKSPEEAFFISNIIKYLYRYPNKGKLTDALKGQKYFTELVEFLQKS